MPAEPPTTSIARYLEVLLEGAPTSMADLPSGTGGQTGVFTVWYRSELLFLGRSYGDPERTSNPQADGVIGRLRMVRRQPPVSVQRATADSWPEDMATATGRTDQNKTTYLLDRHGECRFVKLPSGSETEAVFRDVREFLDGAGPTPLAGPVR
jgi:hypothetical protein